MFIIHPPMPTEPDLVDVLIVIKIPITFIIILIALSPSFIYIACIQSIYSSTINA